MIIGSESRRDAYRKTALKVIAKWYKVSKIIKALIVLLEIGFEFLNGLALMHILHDLVVFSNEDVYVESR